MKEGKSMEKKAEERYPLLEKQEGFDKYTENENRIRLYQRKAFIAGWQEAKKEGWIDVKDRLPGFEVRVIVFGEAKGMNPQMGGAYQFITSRRDLPERMVDENKFHAAYVTHWMPLKPAPPQSIKQE